MPKREVRKREKTIQGEREKTLVNTRRLSGLKKTLPATNKPENGPGILLVSRGRDRG